MQYNKIKNNLSALLFSVAFLPPAAARHRLFLSMADHQPEVWVSDLYSSQKTHPAATWQVCLAHQLRDCQYGLEAGDMIFSGCMKKLLLRAIVLRKRWHDLAETTRYQYRWWSVIFRKITNGFRSDWGRDLFAMVRSIVNTGKRHGLSTFESILAALNPLNSLFSLT